VTVLAVGLAGALGAVCRHLLDVALRRTVGPGPSAGVLTANVAGSLIVGFLVGTAFEEGLDRDLRLAVVVGFCGAFTTFSTLMAEIVNMVEGEGTHEGVGPALGWAMLSVGGGVGAAAVGWSVAVA
jgi:fluoride exporter